MMTESSYRSYNNRMSIIKREKIENLDFVKIKATSDARVEMLIGGMSLFLGIITLFFLIPKSVKVPENIYNIALSPALWPKAICFLIIAVGVFMLISSSKLLWVNRKNIIVYSFLDVQFSKAISWRGLLSVAMLLPYCLAVNFFGLLMPSILAIFFYMLAAGEKDFKALILMSFIFPILLTLFFRYIASVMIPLGPLELFL